MLFRGELKSRGPCRPKTSRKAAYAPDGYGKMQPCTYYRCVIQTHDSSSYQTVFITSKRLNSCDFKISFFTWLVNANFVQLLPRSYANSVFLSFSCYRSVAPCIAITILGNCKRLKKKILLQDTDVLNAKKLYTVDTLLTDTSIKRTPRVGPCLSLLPLFDSL